MDLNNILIITQIIASLAIIYGLWLGVKQLKLERAQRRDLAVMECARWFEDNEFTEAYNLITSLSENQSTEDIKNSVNTMRRQLYE